MAWVKEHEPEIFADAYKVMDVHGYVAWMLTGRPVSSQAAATPTVYPHEFGSASIAP